jgi:TonB family protein
MILFWGICLLSYAAIGQTKPKQKLYVVKKSKKYGVVNQQNEAVIPALYNSIKPVKNTGVVKGFIVSQASLVNADENLYGYLNLQAKAIIPIKYDYIDTMSAPNGETRLVVSNSQKDALFDSKGKPLTGFDYDHMQKRYRQASAILVKKNGLYGYLSFRGKEIIPCVYHKVSAIMKGRAIVDLDQKQGMIDTKGHYVLEPMYDLIEVLNDSLPLFKVKVGGFYGVIGAKGKIVLPITHNQIELACWFDEKAGFIVRKNQQYAFYNHTAQTLNGFVYQLIEPYPQVVYTGDIEHPSQRIVAKKQGKYGYLDLQGKEAIPFVYDWAANFQGGSAKVERQGVSFKIDKTGAKFEKKEETVPKYLIIENQPMPKGGLKKFYRYIAKSLRYPPLAKKRGIEGKVYIQFMIEKDGSLTNFKILKGLGYGCDEEVIRVMKAAPKWNSGPARGVPRRFKRSIPIVFKLKKK